MRYFVFSVLVSFLVALSPTSAQDYEQPRKDDSHWQLLSLRAATEHAGSKVWNGKFTGLNGRKYDVSAFYKSGAPVFSAKAVLARKGHGSISWLVPLSVDNGYRAQLYQAEPLFSLGFGAAMRLAPQSMLSVRVDNALRLGGAVSEQPCYDGFRRQYHCGSGLAWTDYRSIGEDRRNAFALPTLNVKYVKRFSF